MAELKIKARLSFVKLFEPESYQGQDPKYSVALLIPKENKNAIARVNEAIEKAIQEGLKNPKYSWTERTPKASSFKTPLHDGDEKADENEIYAAYEGCMYMNASNKKKPVLIDLDGENLTPDELYSGCWANCILNIYPYNAGGGKGVTASIRGVQKYKDDENLGGGAPVTASSFDSGFGDDDEFFK